MSAELDDIIQEFNKSNLSSTTTETFEELFREVLKDVEGQKEEDQLKRHEAVSELDQEIEERRLKERRKEVVRLPLIKIIENVPEIGYELISLCSSSPEYQNITRRVYKEVESIARVNNPLLKCLYKLKKNEVLETFNRVSEVELFHGTMESNLDLICKTNLDRRLCKAHRFGQGVSFTPDSFYASHYGYGVMLLCKVLLVSGSRGYPCTVIPENGCDHTHNGKGTVYVKYDDHAYYPEYVIRF